MNSQEPVLLTSLRAQADRTKGALQFLLAVPGAFWKEWDTLVRAIDKADAVVEAARELVDIVSAEVESEGSNPALKCPDNDICMTCIASSTDDLVAALEALNE